MGVLVQNDIVSEVDEDSEDHKETHDGKQPISFPRVSLLSYPFFLPLFLREG